MHDDLDDLMKKWDQAQKDGIFGSSKKDDDTHENEVPQYKAAEDTGLSPESQYWKGVYRSIQRSGDPNHVPDPLAALNGEEYPLNENKQTKEDLKQFVKITGSNPNPVSVHTAMGKDQDYEPSFADPSQLEQLHNLKSDLQELEAKLNSANALNKSESKIQKQIDSLRTKIDSLSDEIAPDIFDSEYAISNKREPKALKEGKNPKANQEAIEITKFSEGVAVDCCCPNCGTKFHKIS